MMAPQAVGNAGFRSEAGSPDSRCTNVIRQSSGPLIGSCAGKKWDRRYKGESAFSCDGGYSMETILIVLLVLFLLGGGGWGYSRWRR
jgi:hypothetical protein